MIITLITIGIIIGAVVCWVVSYRFWLPPDWITLLGILLTALSILGSIIVGILIVGTQINKDVEYQNTLYEKEVLEYRIEEANSNIVGNELLYGDIVEFNNNLRTIKKWANNPWTNWFFNEDVATIDYVEINGN